MSGAHPATIPTLPSLHALNEIPREEFAARLGPLFEDARLFLDRLAAERPFADWDAFFDRAVEVALTMPEADQVELLDGHVRLGADPTATRARSESSYREQGYDRPARAAGEPSADVGAELARLNDAYEARFGFRYVVFVAGRSREELLPAMTAALDADRVDELERGLRAAVAIARDRWTKLSGVAGR